MKIKTIVKNTCIEMTKIMFKILKRPLAGDKKEQLELSYVIDMEV
jgi:hypothetical protein